MKLVCIYNVIKYIFFTACTSTIIYFFMHNIDHLRQVRRVSLRVMKKHEELKNKLIEEFGEGNLLSASMALLANYTPKSLITQKYVCAFAFICMVLDVNLLVCCSLLWVSGWNSSWPQGAMYNLITFIFVLTNYHTILLISS